MRRGRELRELRAESTKLGRALEAGRSVNLATGLIMGRLGLTQKEAFETLRQHARSSRTRLGVVADYLLHGTASTARLCASFNRLGAETAARKE